MIEPVLRREDHEAWDYWRRVCDVHARSPGFQRRVTQAKRYVLEALELEPRACVMWSAGKDSTCLAHLVVHELGLTHVPLISQKDDLDYPHEEAFVRELAVSWGAQLEVLRPDVSALNYLREHMREVDQDLHSRSAGLSRVVFYDLVDRASAAYGVRHDGAASAGERRPHDAPLYRWPSRAPQVWQGACPPASVVVGPRRVGIRALARGAPAATLPLHRVHTPRCAVEHTQELVGVRA